MESRRVIKVEETDRLPPAGADSYTPEGLFTSSENESETFFLKNPRDQRKIFKHLRKCSHSQRAKAAKISTFVRCEWTLVRLSTDRIKYTWTKWSCHTSQTLHKTGLFVLQVGVCL